MIALVSIILSCTLGVATLAMVLPTPAERQRVLDMQCGPKGPPIRYPEDLGGPHPAVCNPTGMVWVRG